MKYVKINHKKNIKKLNIKKTINENERLIIKI